MKPLVRSWGIGCRLIDRLGRRLGAVGVLGATRRGRASVGRVARIRPATKRLLPMAVAALLGPMLALGVVGASHGAPHAPTVSSVTPGEGTLTVVWTAPSDAGASAITAYDIRTIETAAADKADDAWDVVDDAWTSGDLTYSVGGLTAGVEYDVQVRAVNAAGDGNWSDTAAGRPLIAPPTDVAITRGDEALTVDWSAPASVDEAEIVAYDVRYIETDSTDKADAEWTVIEEAWTSRTLRYVVAGLENGRGYDVQVRALAGAWSSTATGTPTEHGSSRPRATALTPGTRVGGVIRPGSDVDYFSFVLTETAEVIIFTSGELDTVGELQDSSGTVIETNDEGNISDSPGNFLIWGALDAGTYYINVTSSEQSTGPYVLHLRAKADSSGLADARPIQLDEFENGIIDPRNEIDVFRFELTEATDVIIRSSGAVRDTVGALLNSDGIRIAFDDDGYLSPNIRQFLIRAQLDPVEYYVVIGSWLGLYSGLYTLYVDTATDPGGTRSEATVLTLGDSEGGRIGSTNDTDYFRLDLTDATYVYIQGVSETVDIDGTLLDESGKLVEVTHFEYSFARGGPSTFAIRDRLEAGTYFVRVRRSGRSATGPYTILAIAERQYESFLDSCTAISTTFSDPLYGCQWHLKNTGQRDGTPGEDIDAEAAWATNLGTGVTVAVVDDGLNYAHEDLRDNVDLGRNHDYTGGNDVFDPFEDHGTQVAGIIAARDNSLGMRGVAPRATVYGYNLLLSSVFANVLDAMTRDMATTAVVNNSWGYIDSPGLNAAPRIWELGVEAGVRDGYGGKGVVYVWTAGNGGLRGDNSNLEGYANYYAVTAACAVNDLGQRSAYSEEGANLWVCAPSNDSTRGRAGIATTTIHNRYSGSFGGTSAAAPTVSGVAALVRGTNTSLTWRDVKLILAASARKNDAGNSGWATGALKYGSATERYHFNHEYGFGVVDATAAVDLAQSWTNVPAIVGETVDSTGTEVSIPDNGTRAESSLTMGSDVEFIEFVEINTEFEAPTFRDLEVELVSPSGAISVLSVPFEDPMNPDRRYSLYGSFRFGSARHLGENPAGVWTIRIRDRVSGGGQNTLKSWSLTIHGHTPTSDTQGTVTLSSNQPRVGEPLTATLSDPDGEATELTWTWERSADGFVWTVITEATADSYTPMQDDVGYFLRATVAYTDGDGPDKSALAVTTNRVETEPQPPPAPPPSPPVPSPGPSAPPRSPAPAIPTMPAAPAVSLGVVGRTSAATATELPGNRLRIERHDVPNASFELAIGSSSADGMTVGLAGVIRDETLGQTYVVVRRAADGRIVRRWVPPHSPLVYQIPWAVVNTQFTVPVGVVGAIPLDDQFPEPNLLVRRFDGGDDRIFGYDEVVGQWRHVPDIATFQALGFYWCNVTVADAAFFARINPGPPYPPSQAPARGDYPNCLTS